MNLPQLRAHLASRNIIEVSCSVSVLVGVLVNRSMTEARTLLAEYLRSGSETAFRELVERFTNLVYATALRLVGGDTHLAEDVAQTVFVHLARNAHRISGEAALGGWLHRDTCHVAATTLRTERRRRLREQQAMEMNSAQDHSEANLARLTPVLDEAISQLKSEDQAAVILRFFEQRDFRTVGQSIGRNEDAARMRVNRALEALRSILAHKGVILSAAALGTALAAEGAAAAPAGLAGSLAGGALACAAGGSSILTLIKTMSIPKVSVISALVIAGVGVPVWQETRIQRLRSENARVQVGQTELGQDNELATLRAEVERLRTVQPDQAELDRLRQWRTQTEPELLRLRGMAGVARRANADAEQLRAQKARQETEAANNPMSAAMGDAMKHAMEQRTESQLARMSATLHLTGEQTEAARAILMRQGQAMSASMQQAFSGKFDKDELARLAREAGNPDEQIKALLTPDQRSLFPSYQQEEAAYNARQAASAELLQLSALGLTPEQEDRAFAALYDVSLNQLTGSARAKPASTDQSAILQWSLDQKAQALEPVLTPAQFASYRQQQAIQSKLAQDLWSKMQGTTGAGGSN